MAAQAAAMPKTAQKFKNIIPLFNRILVKRAEPPKESKGGIVLPDVKSAKCLKGTVLAVGPGTRNEKGVLIPMTVKVGDEVMLPDYGGTKVEFEEQTYFLFRESEILAKYNE
ncbi:10 kDa heat shock protein, mitochondrial-like [Anthonomus grandis grandis]|uniref:10 kDa heat shock protein, mitochondrial-like n=1 Tax=Anthonomus grandis grandis TaxID=2921223 RepID=UPI00216688D7|nr:10 kDa heat shock protein, mitochondrial-like [Anthonomus grandis grandis]